MFQRTLQFLLGFIIIQLINTQQITTTRQVVEIAEQQLDQLAAEAKRLYQRRCGSEYTSCDKKIYNECSEVAPEMQCLQDFPFGNQCTKPGAFMSWDHLAGRCQNGNACDTQDDLEISCSQATLFDIDDQGNSLRHNSDSPIVYQYVGFYNGFRVIYPYQHTDFDSNGFCQEYDPRYRPWYVSAASGAKNVVLIIDNSGSMQLQSRLDFAKKAAVAVVETLGQQDWFALVAFGVDANSQQTSLIQATKTNKQQVINDINALGYNGKTNYEAGFTKAFDLLEATNDLEFGSSCGETLLLFLTDGLPTIGVGACNDKLEGQALIDEQQDKNDNEFQPWLQNEITTRQISAKIFTYALGGDAGTIFPKSIACNHKGIFYPIDDATSRTKLMKSMRSYYEYLAIGLGDSLAIWSEIYLDSITGKQFVTAAKNIYVTNDQNVELLLGVAGVDIDIDTIKNTQDYEDVMYEVSSRQRQQCTGSNVELTKCQLNSIRGVEAACIDTVSDTECETYESGTTTCSTPITGTQWVTDYPVGSNGQIIQYQKYQLSPCCIDIKQPEQPVTKNQQILTINLGFIMLLSLFL